MSCSGCNASPCGCGSPPGCGDPCVDIDPCQDVNPDPKCGTKCNLDTSDNLWYTSDQPGYPGTVCQCKLDQLTYGQVVFILQRNPFAARDLMRITNDPCLLELARTVKLVEPEQEENQRVTDRLMRNSLPYYTLFKGNV